MSAMTTRPGLTKRYRDGWIGAVLVAVLITVLISLVPSRVSRMLALFERPPRRAVTWVEVPTFAAIPTIPATPSAAAPVEERPLARSPGAPALIPRPRVPAPPVAAKSAARFTIDFGTFLDPTDLEDAERRLKDAGAETVRYRAGSTVALYVLKIDDLSEGERASHVQRADTALTPAQTVPDKPLRLREAVARAEELRRAGLPVRLQTAREEEPLFGLRLKGDFDATIARAKGHELEGKGFQNSVIRTAPPSS